MKETITRFKKEVILIDKFLIIFISLIPLFLSISIFVADFLASLSGLILLSILIKDNFFFSFLFYNSNKLNFIRL